MICISVYKSKQKPSNVRFIGHSQELLIDVKNWVKAQNPSNVDVDLIRFLELAVGIMSHSVIGNNIYIKCTTSYLDRTDHLELARTYAKSFREFVMVISSLYPVKQTRLEEWRLHIKEIISNLEGVFKSDKKRLIKELKKQNVIYDNIAKYLENIRRNRRYGVEKARIKQHEQLDSLLDDRNNKTFLKVNNDESEENNERQDKCNKQTTKSKNIKGNANKSNTKNK